MLAPPIAHEYGSQRWRTSGDDAEPDFKTRKDDHIDESVAVVGLVSSD